MEKRISSTNKNVNESGQQAAWFISKPLSSGSDLPTGTITYLFTDIEGSTPHWEHHPELMEEALKLHNEVLFEAIRANGGKVFKIVGDEFQAAFTTAPQALQAAIDIQIRLRDADWNELGMLKVRIGLHTGEAHLDDIGDEYAVSPTKNRVGRIRSAAHGGQILLSRETADLYETTLPEGVSLRYLGEYQMKGLTRLEPIYQAIVPGLLEEFPPLSTLTAPKNNLPLELTSFIGREKEIEEVTALLEKHRLVTLTGVGGTGKTRLAIRAAETLLDNYPNGVWFVELASLTDPELVPRTIVNVLGLLESAQQKPLDQLKSFLYQKKLLIVLDNCEHVIADCARISHELLLACPDLKILASSREALGVTGEVSFPVPSLPFPGTHELPTLEQLTKYSSILLFVERAQAVKPSFALGADNASVVAQICKRLDGIPLAIELAAARVNAFSPAQIAEHLDDRFRLLTGGARTAVPRLQTLWASIDWSYSLLAETERLLLIRLSVFQGGWTLELAQSVCGFNGLDAFGVMEGLAQLVNKSLIIADTTEDGSTRYHRLETIRQYAREKLLDSGDSEVLYDRHLDAFLDLAEEAKPHLRRRRHLEWLDRLELELDNLRIALTWALDRDAIKGLRIATALHWFWHCRTYKIEGISWLQQLQERIKEKAIEVNPVLLAETLARQAYLLCMAGLSSQKGYPIAKKALALAEGLSESSKRIQALSLIAMSFNARDYHLAHKLSSQSLEIAEEIDDRFLVFESLNALSITEPDQAKEKAYIDRMLDLTRELGDLDGMMGAQGLLGDYYSFLGEHPQAIQIYDQAIQIGRKIRNHYHIINLLTFRGLAYYTQGEPDLAIESYQQGLEYHSDLCDRFQKIRLYICLGYAFGMREDWLQAEGHFKQAVETVRDSRLVSWEAYSYFGLAEVARLLGQVGTAIYNYQKTVEICQSHPDFDLVGLSAYASGMKSLLSDNLESAEAYFQKALKAYLELEMTSHVADCLEALSVCTIQDCRFEAAVHLHGVAISCRGWKKKKFGASLLIRDEVECVLESVRVALGESRYEELMQEGQAVAVEDVVGYVQELLDNPARI